MLIRSSCGDFVQTTPNFFEKITVDSFAGKQYNDIAEQKRKHANKGVLYI